MDCYGWRTGNSLEVAATATLHITFRVADALLSVSPTDRNTCIDYDTSARGIVYAQSDNINKKFSYYI